MTDLAPQEFRTGQPVWAIEGDGPRRPAEYLGEGERRRERGRQAFVIFVDAPGGGVVDVDLLRPRET